MTVTKAIVTKMDGNNCKVVIPSVNAHEEISVPICCGKGEVVSYSKGDVVFVAWLDSRDWVLLGSLYDGSQTRKQKIDENTYIGESNTSLRDVARLSRYCSEVLPSLLKENQ